MAIETEMSSEKRQRRSGKWGEEWFFLGDEGEGRQRPEEISPPYQMHRNQRYVFERAQDLGITVELLGHTKETRTCTEKAELLSERFKTQWDPMQVVKALYFHPASGDDHHYICVVTPETGKKVDLDGLLSEHGFNGTRYENGKVPRGMAMGTCTPFPKYTQAKSIHEGMKEPGRIEKFIIYDFPHLDDKTVDISVGGNSPDARRTSMHLPYGAIHSILRAEFGDRVVKAEPRYV